MSEPNSKLFKDDPATYYTELGAREERERMIKLLETRNKNKTHSEGRYCGLCEAIELIKSEQK